MKAAQINRYGSNEVVEINKTAPKPTLTQGHLLIETKIPVCFHLLAYKVQ